jgi:hypothetical protein
MPLDMPDDDEIDYDGESWFMPGGPVRALPRPFRLVNGRWERVREDDGRRTD